MSEYKNAEKVINRFHDSSMKFAITVLKLYWDVLEQRDQLKVERDTLIDDLPWYKAKVSRLEQIRDIKDSTLKGADIKIKTLERENKDLRLQSDTYFEQWQNEKLTSQGLREQCKEYAQDASKFLNLLSEFSQHIGNKPSSSKYKYFRAKLDNLNITEDK